MAKVYLQPRAPRHNSYSSSPSPRVQPTIDRPPLIAYCTIRHHWRWLGLYRFPTHASSARKRFPCLQAEPLAGHPLSVIGRPGGGLGPIETLPQKKVELSRETSSIIRICLDSSPRSTSSTPLAATNSTPILPLLLRFAIFCACLDTEVHLRPPVSTLGTTSRLAGVLRSRGPSLAASSASARGRVDVIILFPARDAEFLHVTRCVPLRRISRPAHSAPPLAGS